jgi:alpha-L-arabinofuranosidase
MAGIGDFRAALDDGVLLDFVPSEASAGDQYLRITFPGGSRTASGVRHYLKALPGADYTLRVRARTDLAGVRLSVEFRNFGIPEAAPGNRVTLAGTPADGALDGNWRTFTFTGSTPDDDRIDTGLSAIAVFLTAPEGAPPGAAYLDDIVLEDEALATPSGFSRPLVERLKEARCGTLRFYGIAELGSLVEGMTAPGAAEAPWTYLSLASFGRANLVHAVIDQWMVLASEVGAQPWITVGGPNFPNDWQRLVSYLAAPAGFDAASAQRAAQGRVQPWLDDFDTIYLEIGNEWWNSLFSPYHIQEPAKYGEFCATVAQAVRAHPHFDPDRIKIVAGGWAINANNWNGTVDAVSEGHDLVSIAPYLLHALDRHDTPEARYGALFADVAAYAQDGGRRTREALAANGKGTGVAVYELNTHLVSGQAPAEVASAVCTSVAAGVAVLDQAMAVMSDLGASPINYFTALQRGFNSGGTRLGLWGVLLRTPDGSLRPRPVWHGLRLANQHLIEGDLVRAVVEEGPTWNQPENGSVPATANVPFLAAYAFRREGGHNLLLVNRHRAQSIAVAVEGLAPASGPVRTHLLTADRISDNNEDAERVVLREGTAAPEAGALTLNVPPFSALVARIETNN